MNDAVILLRDIAGDAATKAASKVNPSEDELRQIDEPAPDHTWHEAPDLSRENIKNQMSQRTGRQAPAGARDSGYQPGDVTTDNQQSGDQSGLDTDAAKEAAKGRTAEARDRARNYLSRKVPDERRDRTIWRLKKMVVEIQSHPDCKEPTHA